MKQPLPVSVVMFCTVMGVVVLVGARRLSPPHPSTGQSELSAITETIRAAFVTRGQACMANHYGDRSQFEAALNQYWSPATPEPSRMATLTVLWAGEYPTMEPALYAEIVATAEAEYSAGIIDEKTYLYSIDASEPTPDWNPAESPRDVVQRHRIRCYTKPGYVKFGVASVYDADFSIVGDRAEGTVQIAWWAKIRDAAGTEHNRQHDEKYQYVLEQDGVGSWMLLSEFQVSGRGVP